MSKGKKGRDATDNPTVYDRYARKQLRCNHCAPNRGENEKTRRKHGVTKPKKKDKR